MVRSRWNFFIFLERSLGLSEARVNDPHLFALQVLSHFVDTYRQYVTRLS